MKSISTWKHIFFGSIGIILALCANEPASMAANKSSKTGSAHHAAPKKGPRWVLIELPAISGGAGGTGTLSVYDGEIPVRKFRASGGRSNHPTRTGTFQIRQRVSGMGSPVYGECIDKKRGKRRSVGGGERSCGPGEKYQGFPMPHFQSFDGEIGIHGSKNPDSASHGCVRVSNENARQLWSLLGPGTRVVVKTIVRRAAPASRPSPARRP